MSRTKDCNAIENDLCLFVGGELGPRSRAEVEQHLQVCAACVESVGRLSAARAALRAGLEHGEARVPDLWQGVRARLLESGTIRPALARPAAPARRMPRWFPHAAAAAVLAAFGVWLLQPEPQPKKRDPITVEEVAQRPAPPPLRRLVSGESALSESATTIEQLQEEARLQEALRQPAGAQTASQRRGMH